MVNSPLSGKASRLIGKVDREWLVKAYSGSFGIDVLPLLPNNIDLALYEDIEYKYRFFHPFHVTGDDKFYQGLEKFDWYYMPWKWEHEVSLNYIKNNLKVLEVGCGSGGFLKKVSSKVGKDNVVGLELNSDAVSRLQAEDYLVYDSDITKFSSTNKDVFDLVCSFQVLEHIADVRGFINAKIDCLKRGGKLIISVPNNDSTLFHINYGGALNYPPHHLGMWNKASLKALQDLFPIKLKKFYFEPLQEYHWDWYLSIIDYKVDNSSFSRFLKKYPRLKSNLHSLLRLLKPSIKGHSIVAVYEKQ
ncbi:methyltransferase family protein [Pontibacter ummariensis]|uniref:Methyltransferase domain-containing protein n=1 Tax=Pontibacter ummariensis TaxID=1610492 RepID=A0A239BLW5_9BACT|nr:class I SAM-dependent methyltransferase [Pontibacter ummariensis]PRY15774.1 methyltransferase family protein [Pontibacter ummariensis]SNS08609.1 Methyltransferase domain-containing protein [Pontibacter ummariensis]